MTCWHFSISSQGLFYAHAVQEGSPGHLCSVPATPARGRTVEANVLPIRALLSTVMIGGCLLENEHSVRMASERDGHENAASTCWPQMCIFSCYLVKKEN